jgi:hypothetical protein
MFVKQKFSPKRHLTDFAQIRHMHCLVMFFLSCFTVENFPAFETLESSTRMYFPLMFITIALSREKQEAAFTSASPTLSKVKTVKMLELII